MVDGFDGPVTVLRSRIFEETAWAVTDVLPGGRNTPFTGIPSAAMHGADSVKVLLEDFTIPAEDTPVTVPAETIFLNERNVEDFELDGDLYDFYFCQNPAKRTLGTMTFVASPARDDGPRRDGWYMRETTLELLAILVPRSKGQIVVSEATIPIASTVPIPFTFNPLPGMFVLEGAVGDDTVNWHVDKTESQRNIFIGEGLVQVQLGGMPLLDEGGYHAMRGNNKLAALRTGGIPRDANGNPAGAYAINDTQLIDGVPPDGNNLLNENDATGLAITYQADTGGLGVVVPKDIHMTAIRISSSSGMFRQVDVSVLGGPLDRSSVVEIFKVGLGTTFQTVGFGQVLRPGLSKQEVLNDLSARAFLSNGTPRSRLGLTYVEAG